MSETIPVEFIVNTEAIDQIDDVGLRWKKYGKLISVTESIDETLLESLTNDELIEHIGIDSEFLVYMNVKE